MRIFVYTIEEKRIRLEVQYSDTIQDIKRKIQSKECIRTDEQELTFMGKLLEGDQSLSSYGIREGLTLNLVPRFSINIPDNARWEQKGITVAGRDRPGNALDQLNCPCGLYVDDDQTIYVADWWNNRIMKWKIGATSGEVVAGGYRKGNKNNQLNYPIDVIVDRETNSLIISDRDNRRVIKWSLQNGTKDGEIIIENIACYGLVMDRQRFLYVADTEKHEVRRYEMEEMQGIIVAGGNGKGPGLNQLNRPTYVFVDQDHSVYVSDENNNRVMKWKKNAKEGIVVACDVRHGNALTQLHYPKGVIVDQLGRVYVTDFDNHRVVCWNKGMTEGVVIVGGNGLGAKDNQLNYPVGLSFDRHGNMYVADHKNHQIQRFSIE